MKALQRKAVRTALAESLQETAIAELKGHIQALEAEIRRLIDQDPDYRQLVGLLLSIPGVGLLLAAQMLVVQTAPQPCSPKRLAAFIGICPYEDFQWHLPAPSPDPRHYGPATLRKLLFLAAMSIATHNPHFLRYRYFLRKVQEGKPKQLVLNNIANKLLKVMVAVVRVENGLHPNYRSVNPGLLKQALTKS